MTSKYCTKCEILKLFSDFSKFGRAKDGLSHSCKSCVKIKADTASHTRDGLIASIYSTQKRNSKKRKCCAPNYSLRELKAWFCAQIVFDALYLNWINSGYDSNKRPSVDRKNDYLPYTLDNIQLMTWGENREKGHSDRKAGINNKRSKSVIQLTLEMAFIKKHYSQCSASRETGVTRINISKCCYGDRKTAGGFKWRFA